MFLTNRSIAIQKYRVGSGYPVLLILLIYYFSATNKLVAQNANQLTDLLTISFLKENEMDIFPNPVILLVNPNNCTKDVVWIQKIIDNLRSKKTFQLITVFYGVRQTEYKSFLNKFPFLYFDNVFNFLDSEFFQDVNPSKLTNIIFRDSSNTFQLKNPLGFYSLLLNDSPKIQVNKNNISIIKLPKAINETLGQFSEYLFVNEDTLIILDKRYHSVTILNLKILDFNNIDISFDYKSALKKELNLDPTDVEFAVNNIPLINSYGFNPSIITHASIGFDKLLIEHIIYYASLDSVSQSGDSSVSINNATIIEVFDYINFNRDYYNLPYDQVEGYFYLPWINFGSTDNNILHFIGKINLSESDTLFSCASFQLKSDTFLFLQKIFPVQKEIIDKNLAYTFKMICKKKDAYYVASNPISLDFFNYTTNITTKINRKEICTEEISDFKLVDFQIRELDNYDLLIKCGVEIAFLNYSFNTQKVTNRIVISEYFNSKPIHFMSDDSIYSIGIDDLNSYIIRYQFIE